MNIASSGGSCEVVAVVLSASEDEEGVVALDDVAEVSFSFSSAARCTMSLALIMSASRSWRALVRSDSRPCADVSTFRRMPAALHEWIIDQSCVCEVMETY